MTTLIIIVVAHCCCGGDCRCALDSLCLDFLSHQQHNTNRDNNNISLLLDLRSFLRIPWSNANKQHFASTVCRLTLPPRKFPPFWFRSFRVRYLESREILKARCDGSLFLTNNYTYKDQVLLRAAINGIQFCRLSLLTFLFTLDPSAILLCVLVALCARCSTAFMLRATTSTINKTNTVQARTFHSHRTFTECRPIDY